MSAFTDEDYRRVLNERDEARAETVRLRRLLNMAEDELIAADDHGRREAKRADTVEAEAEALKAERDEAIAREAEWAQNSIEWQRNCEEARAEVERLHRMFPVHPSSLTDACTDAYRRGAEAMREACAQWVDHWVSGHVADKLRDMPIPEEP